MRERSASAPESAQASALASSYCGRLAAHQEAGEGEGRQVTVRAQRRETHEAHERGGPWHGRWVECGAPCQLARRHRGKAAAHEGPSAAGAKKGTKREQRQSEVEDTGQ